MDDALLTDDERSHLAWAANAAAVALDPHAATATDLRRAMGFLSHRLVAIRYRAERDGRPVDRELLATLGVEMDWYARILRERGPRC